VEVQVLEERDSEMKKAEIREREERGKTTREGKSVYEENEK